MLRALVVLLAFASVAATAVVLRPEGTRANPQGGIVAVSSGSEHTCALTNAGGVKCWGFNFYGQLGDGSTTNRSTPVDVAGLATGVAAISAGGYHTCALTTAGGVKCWGENGAGELGTTTTETCTYTPCSTAPVDVTGMTSGVASISAGGFHNCALTNAGGAKCWGHNDEGQLGNGTTTTAGCLCIPTPVDVSGLVSTVAAVSAGGNYSCALSTSGGVKCWGNNAYGQLGDGTTTNSSIPVDVSGLATGAAAVSAGGGYHACALTTVGGVKCWGYNIWGQLGNGTPINSSTPVDVSGLSSGVGVVSVGHEHTCALTTAGGVKCWGLNQYGELGDGTNNSSSTAVDVFGLTTGGVAISAGYAQTCAIASSGDTRCWGRNYWGKLGNGTASDSSVPTDVLVKPKPTPTPTFTATPTPITPYTGHLSIGSCTANCVVPVPGSNFTVDVNVDTVPATYDALSFDLLSSTGTCVSSNTNAMASSWPSRFEDSICVTANTASVAGGKALSPPATQTGKVGEATFKCSQSGMISVGSGSFVVSSSTGASIPVAITNVNVICASSGPTATPTTTSTPTATAVLGAAYTGHISIGTCTANCSVSANSTFTASLNLDTIRAPYDAVELDIVSSTGSCKSANGLAVRTFWPAPTDLSGCQNLSGLGEVAVIKGVTGSPSIHLGKVGEITFNCSRNGTLTLDTGHGTSFVVNSLNGISEPITMPSVQVTCKSAAAVGGLALDRVAPHGDADRRFEILITVAAAGALVLGGTAWYGSRLGATTRRGR